MNREINDANINANAIGELQNSINGIEAGKNRIRGEIGGMQDTIEWFKDEISRLEREITRFENDIDGLEHDIGQFDLDILGFVQQQEPLKAKARRQHRNLHNILRRGGLVPVERREAKSAMERLEEFVPDLRPRQG